MTSTQPQQQYAIGMVGPGGENSILSMYFDLIALRRNQLCGQNIHIYHLDNEAKVIAFHRSNKQRPKDSVVVVVNMTNQNRDGYVIAFPRVGLWKRAL